MPSDKNVERILNECRAKHGNIKVIKTLEGHLLEKRYMLSKKLNEGAFGQIYSGFDIKEKINGQEKPIVIKFSKNHQMNDVEFKALTDVAEKAKANGVEMVGTFSKGQVLVLDRELRTVKHFSQLGDEEMMKAFED